MRLRHGLDPHRLSPLRVNRAVLEEDSTRAAFLRGAFLGAGTVTNPEKGYHFEWKADDEHLPQVLEKLLLLDCLSSNQ